MYPRRYDRRNLVGNPVPDFSLAPARRNTRTFKTAQFATGHQKYPSSPRPISTGLLIALLRLHSRPIDLVVYQGSYSLKGMGELISRPASRLDAFSGYPLHT